jgi:hypothetical protein
MKERKEEFIKKFKEKNLSVEDINFLVHLIEENDKKEYLNAIEFPEEYEVNLGYEELDVKYIVCENKNELNIFNESVPSEYVLFMVKDDKFIAVDGGSKRNTWAIPEKIL